jgi:hypothetical protein
MSIGRRRCSNDGGSCPRKLGGYKRDALDVLVTILAGEAKF